MGKEKKGDGRSQVRSNIRGVGAHSYPPRACERPSGPVALRRSSPSEDT